MPPVEPVATPPARSSFSAAPADVVVFEMVPFDEPVIEKDISNGIRTVVGRNVGETLSVRSVRAHLEGQTAWPIDGGDPIPYGPGKPGHWARHATSGK